MFEPFLSTSSKTCMHLKNFKFFSSARRPETQIRHVQSHQKPNASTGSNNNIQSTVITAYEVQQEETFNNKLAKQTIWFSAVIKEFHRYFHEKRTGRHKKIENYVALHC